MSAGSVSLESAIRTCKVNTGWASRISSDRFLNPNNMVCPVWNGVDSAGREVCPDSFYTKREGCNSAHDRVSVENDVSRPQYMSYITLSANGIRGNIYGDQQKNLHKITGQFGNVTGFNAEIHPEGCSHTPYRDAMAQQATQNRESYAVNHGYRANIRRNMAGMN
jgi:hypothetical protein